MMLFENKGL